ncbi:CYTH domain-containing protein [Candidatus Poribacteria bacterium]|nr:CYTH domain-containing protein [Candidatus Poribacteria bacterium]
MAYEVEVKFQITSPQIFDLIRAQKQVADYRLTNQRIIPQRDTYLDTPAGTLFQQGVGLRLREKKGAYVVTFKRQLQGIHVRTELDDELTAVQAQALLKGNLVDVSGEAGQAAMTYLQTKDICPVLHVENTRESWHIHAGAGRVEICFDDVRYINPEQMQCVQGYELELELKAGDVALLQDIAHALSQQYHLNPSSQSKYERGVELFRLFAPGD